MGQLSNTRIIILALCLILTGAIIFSKSDRVPLKKQILLRQALAEIKGCETSNFSPLEENIAEALKLDDYLNQYYQCGGERMSLYIGYYLTTKKVGAAHDPLVCFPGQGWVLSDRNKNKILIDKDADLEVSYSMMTASRGDQKELIVYWFQSYDKTNPDTLSQKITSLVNKVAHSGEDNAFVRITMSIGEKNASECHDAILRFVRDFYPMFLAYIKNNSI